MPTEKLQIGVPTAIVQNTIYALPPYRVLLFCDGTSPTFQQSTTVAFTANVAVTLTIGQAELAGGFLRCTSATPGNVVIKANK